MRKPSWISGIVALPLLALTSIACYSDYYVDTPPPPPQQEVIGVAPYPGAVYINGYWQPRGRQYVWRRGYWDRPRPGRVYQAPRYEQRGNRYYYQRGRYR